MQTDEQLIEAIARGIAKANGHEEFWEGYLGDAELVHTIAKAHWEARVEALREELIAIYEDQISQSGDDMGDTTAARIKELRNA